MRGLDYSAAFVAWIARQNTLLRSYERQIGWIWRYSAEPPNYRRTADDAAAYFCDNL
jgi:hypothetical protein